MVKGFSPLVLLGVVVILVVGGVLVVSQSDLDLQLAPCTPPNCFGGGITPAGKVGNVSRVDPIPDGDNQIKVKFPLFTNTEKLYIDDPIGKIKSSLQAKDLPTVLRRGTFKGNVVSPYSQFIQINTDPYNAPRIIFGKEPSVNVDPIDGIKLSTLAGSTYSDRIAFERLVDFTSPASKGKTLVLFGKTFKVDASTTSNKLVLINVQDSNDRLSLVHGQEVKQGIDETAVPGTQVDFHGTPVNNLTEIEIAVFAPVVDKDFISVGQSVADPVFGTFQISYEGLSIVEGDTDKRDLISLTSDGGHPHLLVMDTRIDEQNFTMGDLPFVTDVNGTPYLGYGPMKQIRVVEMRDIKKGEYVVVGDHNNGRLLELITLTNSSGGYSDDNVRFRDSLSSSGNTHSVLITSEGHGTVIVQGKTYDVTYFDNPSVSGDEYVRLNYPDSPPMEAIFYPVFKTYLGAKIMYYDQIYMNLNTLPQYYGGTIGGPLTLNLPDGEGSEEVSIIPTNITGVYSVITPDLQAETTLDTRPNSNEDKTINFYIGKLSWKLVKDPTALHRALLYLEPVSGVEGINNPALVVFENRSDTGYEALIVKPEFSGPNGAGVLDVETTWGQDTKFDEIQMESNPNMYKSLNRYGTYVWTDRTDSDQWISGIFYPKEQVYAKVYIQEI